MQLEIPEEPDEVLAYLRKNHQFIILNLLSSAQSQQSVQSTHAD